MKKIIIVVTGDPGLYSFMEYLKLNLKEVEIEVLPGISSFQYLCSKLKMSWDDVYITSLHGRENSGFVDIVKSNRKTAVFTGGANSPDKVCKRLLENRIENVLVTVGENLSYENERIVAGTPEEITKLNFESLSIMIIENNDKINKSQNGIGKCTIGIPDGEFIRGNVPMTKEEIRTISISKLRLKPNSVVFDIGAGTGSVSMECGLICSKGKVFAVECNPEGIDLIKRNKEKFNIENLFLIEGKAPEVLNNDIQPDRVFIGGTKGNMDNILKWAAGFDKNIIVVINSITIESTYEAMESLEKNGFENIEIINISISKSMKAGNKHLMKAINPVYIITAEKQCCGGLM